MGNSTTADEFGLFEVSRIRLLPNAGPLARVFILDNEIQAQVLHGVLEAENIPHNVECYRDCAYDGLFQVTRGWGAIITRQEDAERALSLIEQALKEFCAE
jgi:hypothetical protein